MKTYELKTLLRSGKYAWPGGYPIYFITADGASLSYDSVKSNYREVLYGTKHNTGSWNISNYDVNWENPELYCEHSGQRIESAYCEE